LFITKYLELYLDCILSYGKGKKFPAGGWGLLKKNLSFKNPSLGRS